MTPPPGHREKFGNYQVLELLGRGMQGETYLATDPSGRRVAVKTIHADAMSPRKARQALNAEHDALRSVHPAFVPQFLEADTVNGWPYLVMEYIEGTTIEDLIRKNGTLSEVEVKRLAVRLADILTALHAAGIAHGDFRGQNIIVGKDGGTYLIDFGRAVRRSDSKKQFYKRRASDLRQMGELLVQARDGYGPFGEDSSLAIERFSEGRPDVGRLSGRTKEVALALLTKRPWWRRQMSACRARRTLVQERQRRRCRVMSFLCS